LICLGAGKDALGQRNLWSGSGKCPCEISLET
jgi:hypothetical protein